MVREKVSRKGSEREVIYSSERWKVLAEKRTLAKKVMECLLRKNIQGAVYGSVARGDVSSNSDVDVVITYPVPSYMLEILLDECGFKIYEKVIVMATPSHVPKAYYYLSPDELLQVNFPLARLREREIEFYSFGGSLNFEGLLLNKRVPGVNKRLELILPTERGHIQKSIIGIEEEVSRLLGISIDTIRERIRVLTKRDEKGRTGVYLNISVPPEQSVEEKIIEVSQRDHNVKKILKERG